MHRSNHDSCTYQPVCIPHMHSSSQKMHRARSKKNTRRRGTTAGRQRDRTGNKKKRQLNCFLEVGAGNRDDVARRRAESGRLAALDASRRSRSRLAASRRQEHRHDEGQRYKQRGGQHHHSGSTPPRPSNWTAVVSEVRHADCRA